MNVSEAIYDEVTAVDYDIGATATKDKQADGVTAVDYDIGVTVKKEKQYDEAYTE